MSYTWVACLGNVTSSFTGKHILLTGLVMLDISATSSTQSHFNCILPGKHLRFEDEVRTQLTELYNHLIKCTASMKEPNLKIVKRGPSRWLATVKSPFALP